MFAPNIIFCLEKVILLCRRTEKLSFCIKERVNFCMSQIQSSSPHSYRGWELGNEEETTTWRCPPNLPALAIRGRWPGDMMVVAVDRNGWEGGQQNAINIFFSSSDVLLEEEAQKKIKCFLSTRNVATLSKMTAFQFTPLQENGCILYRGSCPMMSHYHITSTSSVSPTEHTPCRALPRPPRRGFQESLARHLPRQPGRAPAPSQSLAAGSRSETCPERRATHQAPCSTQQEQVGLLFSFPRSVISVQLKLLKCFCGSRPKHIR